ncbi:MAG: tetratricopeptide repeat protein [Verrucomicrobiota bacterium]
MTWMAGGLLRADDAGAAWTSDDTATARQADALMAQGHPEAAAALYRQLRDRHPRLTQALLYDVKGLLATGAYREAYDESVQAVALNPSDAIARVWLGLALIHLQRDPEAIATLQTAAAMDPDGAATIQWLAAAYRQVGEPAKADALVDGTLKGQDPAQAARTLEQFGDVYHSVDDAVGAVAAWQRAAQLGNRDAAKWLAWAYSAGTACRVTTATRATGSGAATIPTPGSRGCRSRR